MHILHTDCIMWQFQHTAARRRLAAEKIHFSTFLDVSTHSRPKAAGMCNSRFHRVALFQHTAARRRLDLFPTVL